MSALVCPACRRLVDGALHVRLLSDTEPGLLGCACGARYPVVDGIPIVLRDLAAWLEGEGAEALRRADLPDACARLIAEGAGGALARNDALVATYERSREGELQDWLRARGAALEGRVLELGAGLGGLDRDDHVALDLNLALLRRNRARQRVCGDAADPPFLGGDFDAVVVANLLDSCRDPAVVLAQADALLRPGGRLIVTCAYAFQDSITPRAHRFSPADLRAALDGERPFLGYFLPHRLVEEAPRLAWPLVVSDRTRHVHAVQALVSVKRDEAGRPPGGCQAD